MIQLESPQTRFDADSSSVITFFHCFSRLEFALKRAGYVLQTDQKDVAPDWNRFANDLNKHFNPSRTREIQSAVDYLASNPPKKQVLKNGSLDFADCQRKGSGRDLRSLLDSTRCIRHNLFHGGFVPNHFQR